MLFRSCLSPLPAFYLTYSQKARAGEEDKVRLIQSCVSFWSVSVFLLLSLLQLKQTPRLLLRSSSTKSSVVRVKQTGSILEDPNTVKTQKTRNNMKRNVAMLFFFLSVRKLLLQ